MHISQNILTIYTTICCVMTHILPQDIVIVHIVHTITYNRANCKPIRHNSPVQKWFNTTLLEHFWKRTIWYKLYFSHFCNLYARYLHILPKKIAMKSKFYRVIFVGLLILRTILGYFGLFMTHLPVKISQIQWKYLVSSAIVQYSQKYELAICTKIGYI